MTRLADVAKNRRARSLRRSISKWTRLGGGRGRLLCARGSRLRNDGQDDGGRNHTQHNGFKRLHWSPSLPGCEHFRVAPDARATRVSLPWFSNTQWFGSMTVSEAGLCRVRCRSGTRSTLADGDITVRTERNSSQAAAGRLGVRCRDATIRNIKCQHSPIRDRPKAPVIGVVPVSKTEIRSTLSPRTEVVSSAKYVASQSALVSYHSHCRVRCCRSRPATVDRAADAVANH